MISKKSGMVTPLAMVFAIGVGMYIISIGISLNSASYKVVRHSNLSKFTHVVNFFKNTNNIYKDAKTCEGCTEYNVAISPTDVINLLSVALPFRVNKIETDADDSISISPGTSITAPVFPVSASNKDRFSHVLLTFSRSTSCLDSLSVIDKYEILGYSSNKTNVPTEVEIISESNNSGDWLSYPDPDNNINTILELCGLIDNNKLWVHYGL